MFSLVIPQTQCVLILSYGIVSSFYFFFPLDIHEKTEYTQEKFNTREDISASQGNDFSLNSIF